VLHGAQEWWVKALATAWSTLVQSPLVGKGGREARLRSRPRESTYASQAMASGERVYNKTGNGVGRFIDSGLFDTDTAVWIVAAMADEP
jgi:hypothetical protein